MIQKFVDHWMANKSVAEEAFRKEFPGDYDGIVSTVMGILAESDDYYGAPDPSRITRIDHGDYQGTILFVVGAKGYQPSTYWAVKVGYGSCSGCDTLKHVRELRGWSEEGPPVTDEQVKQLMTMALHVVQGLKEIGDEE